MKYNNTKTVVDGIKFDSKREGARYLTLKHMEQDGLIQNLILQPKFLLQDKFRYQGKAIREINYIADFEYVQGGVTIVEDVKGMETKDFILKKKLFLKQYGENIDFRLVK